MSATLSLLFAGNSRAQNLEKLPEADLSVPASPANVILGTNEDQIVRPSTPRQLSLAIANGLTRQGKLQSGVAIDFLPYFQFGKGSTISLEKYQEKHGLEYILSKTSLSFGSAKAADTGDNAIRIALGLNTAPLERGDPLKDKEFLQRLKEQSDITNYVDTAIASLNTPSFVAGAPPPPPPDFRPSFSDETKANLTKTVVEPYKQYQELMIKRNALANDDPNRTVLDTAMKSILTNIEKERTSDDTAIKKIQKDWEQKYAYASVLTIAAAPAWLSEDGTTNKLHNDGYAAWASYGFNAGKAHQFILHMRYRDGEHVKDNDTNIYYKDNTFLAGGRIRGGTSELTLSLEAVYNWRKRSGQTRDNFTSVNAIIERKLSDGLWLGAVIGSEFGRKDGNLLNVGANFKWGSYEKPKLTSEK